MTKNSHSCATTFLFAVAGFLVTQPATADDKTAFRCVLRSTFLITTEHDEESVLGMGVLVDEKRKLVLTAAHVVQGRAERRPCALAYSAARLRNTPRHYLENASRLGIAAELIAVDNLRDLALVELSKLPEECHAIRIAEKSSPPGTKIHAFGHLGSLWTSCWGSTRCVYDKRFRGEHGEEQYKVIEGDWLLLSRASSEVLVNGEGELIAMTTKLNARNPRSGDFSLDIVEVKAFLHDFSESTIHKVRKP